MQGVLREVFRELQGLSELSPHPNVVQLAGVAFTTHEGLELPTWLLMEMCSGGTLHDRIYGGDGNAGLPPATAARFALQIGFGLNHIHEHNFIHRDLKPKNILFDWTENHVKIADLGLARLLSNIGTLTQGMISLAGTPV